MISPVGSSSASFGQNLALMDTQQSGNLALAEGQKKTSMNSLQKALEVTKNLDLNSGFKKELQSFDKIGRPVDILTGKPNVISKFVF